MNIFDALENAKDRFPDKEAILFGSESLTYRHLYERSCRLSAALKTIADLRRGERIGLFLPNRPDFVVSYYAVVRLGAIAVSLNVMLKHEEVKFILNDCEAKLLITTSSQLDQVPVANEIPPVKKVVCTSKTDHDETLDMEALSSSASGSLTSASLAKKAGAAILYTSGTTGKPKGVLL